MKREKMEHFYQNIQGYFTFPDFYKWAVEQLPSDQPSRCVELGVHSGRSAAFLAVEINNSGKPAKLDLIDLFTNGSIHNRPRILSMIHSNFATVRHIVDKIIPSDSAEAASQYDDKSVDFLFIDASHEYDYVKKDIAAWLPKMKSGAIMAGHDFEHIGSPGVCLAVMEAFDEWHIHRGEKFYGNDQYERKNVGEGGRYFPCWWVKIP